MSQRTRSCLRMILLGIVVSAGWAVAAEEGGKDLQYRFKAGETYIYTVSIVGEIGPTTETSKGQIQFTVKSADDSQLQLTPYVVLSTKSNAPASKPTGKGVGKGSFPKRPPMMFAKTKVVNTRELFIDPYGKVLKFSGETSLPLLLGTAEQLVIEPLSKGEKSWQRDRDLVIVDSSEAKTPAKEVVKYEVASSAGSTIKIKKTYDLKTSPKGAEALRIQLTGTSDIVFDAEAGLIKSGEFKGAIAVTEKNVTGRIPVTVSYRLLTAEEVAAAKKEEETARIKAAEAAKEAAAPKPIDDAELTRAVEDVKAGRVKGAHAADRLAKAIPVEGRRKNVVDVLTAAVKGQEDGSLRPAAAKALTTWATAQDVPTFIDLLNDKNVRVRKAAFDGLGELKDAKGAEAVAQKMSELAARRDAFASLKAMGKVAEKPVLGLLNDRDWKVRAEACKLLGEIGTNESLAALKKAQADSNAFVAREAAKAVKTVEGR
jgi:hypothetical protein